jgi:hypothetical protein
MPQHITDKAQDLVKRFRRLESKRTSQWDVHYEELTDYINPQQSDIRQVETPGTKRTSRLFASAVLNAVSTAVASISGILVPTTSRWFSIEFKDNFLNELEGVPAWLEESSNIMFEEMINSNLKTMIGRIIRDLLVIGTGNIFITAKEGVNGYNGLMFRVYQAGSYVISENHESEVDVVFQKLKMSARAAAAEWGEKKLSPKVQQLLKSKPDDEIEILHAMIPREGIYKKDISPDSKVFELPFESTYIELKTKHTISEGGFHEKAYLVPRWMVLSGEVYGRSPAMDALPEIKSLNKQRELILKGMAKAIDPPLTILDRGVVGKVKTSPGALIYQRVDGAVKPLFLQGDFQSVLLNEQKMEELIRQIFFNHLLQFPTQGASTPVTATEFSLRNEQMLRNAIPSIAIIEDELLAPLVERVFGLLLRAGQLPAPPVALLEAAEGVVKFNVKYSNPVSKAQKSAEADSLVRFVSVAVGLAEVIPGILDVFKAEEAGFFLADRFSVPKTIMRSREEVLLMNQAKAQVLLEEQRGEGLLKTTEGLRNLTPIIKTLKEGQAQV